MYAELIVDNTSSNTDRSYTYAVPDYLMESMGVGKRVLVSFGRGEKLVEGIVLELKQDIDEGLDLSKIKSIEYLVEDESVVSEEVIRLVKWMREKYLSKYIEVLRTVIPSGLILKSKKFVKVTKQIDLDCFDSEVVSYLNSKKKIELNQLKNKFKSKDVKSTLNSLSKLGFLKIEENVVQNVNKQFIKVVKRSFKPEEAENIVEAISPRAKKQREVVEILKSIDEIELKELLIKASTSDSTLKSLQKKELVRIVEKEKNRNPVLKEIENYKKIVLNESQKRVFDEIEKKSCGKYLIHGVTGSGKTEIYLQLIEKAIERGEDSIVLVPEISLTPQTMDRFMGRFKGQVAIYHSKLSVGERYDEWRKIKQGKVKIVIGTRSAIFSPFKNLGLIIIDEEHEQSYKSSMNPKYNTIEVAEKRGELESATLVLGSATPSVETFYKTETGEIELLEIKSRANRSCLPNISLIDMKEELYNGNKSIFSYALYNAITEKLKRKEQIILFLNSRGFSKFVSCRSCGYVVKCNNCDISMTYHAENGRLICHYCGESRKLMTECPVCKSKYIKHMGLGTQRVELEIKKCFPDAKVDRMDLDTTSKKNSYSEILDKFKEKKTDILIGTQMISKGLDFPNVTLVGVIIADTALNLPDYKSSERTFQLMTQVAGRAGRSDLEGEVIIQTYDPEHYSLLSSKKHDYEEFYGKEIMLRKLFRYPPFCEIVDITVYGEDETLTINTANSVNEKLKEQILKSESLKEIEVLGPNPALIYRVKNRFRMKIVLKANSENMKEIRSILKQLLALNTKYSKIGVKVSIDINPSSII